MKRIALFLVILATSITQAQSLKETTDFLHDFVDAHGSFGDENWHESFHVTFNGCSMTVVDNRKDVSCSRPENKDVCSGDSKVTSYVLTSSTNLKELEPTTETDLIFSTYGGYWVEPTTRNDRAVVSTSTSTPYGPVVDKDTRISVGLSTESAAKRVAKALNHAVILCGGKASAF